MYIQHCEYKPNDNDKIFSILYSRAISLEKRQSLISHLSSYPIDSKTKTTLLHHATASRPEIEVSLYEGLVKRFGFRNTPDINGQTPLMLLCGKGEKWVNILKDKTITNTDLKDSDGNSAFIICSAVNNAQLLGWLSTKDITINHKNKLGLNAMEVAIFNENMESVNVLWDKRELFEFDKFQNQDLSQIKNSKLRSMVINHIRKINNTKDDR